MLHDVVTISTITAHGDLLVDNIGPLGPRQGIEVVLEFLAVCVPHAVKALVLTPVTKIGTSPGKCSQDTPERTQLGKKNESTPAPKET